MFPGLPKSAETDGRLRDAVSFCKISERSGRVPTSLQLDLPRRDFGEFGEMLPFTSRFVGASLLDAVIRIGLVVSEEEMIRSNARSVVAAMEHEFPIQNLPIGQFPSDAMGHQGSLVPATNHPVALVANPSRPDPTPRLDDQGTRLLDSTPEPECFWSPQFSNGSTSSHAGEIARGAGGLQLS